MSEEDKERLVDIAGRVLFLLLGFILARAGDWF